MATVRLPREKVIKARPVLQAGLRHLWYRDYAKPHLAFAVETRDGVTLRGVQIQSGHSRLLIYCHGFLANKNYSAVPRFLEMMSNDVDVISFDFRGHGESDGATTLGEREVFDLEAVIEYAHGFGYRHIFLLGSSMGGAVAIRVAADSPHIAGVATIGAYAYPDFTKFASFAVNFFRLPITHKVVRMTRACRVESVHPSSTPLEVIERVSPRPVLLMHGALDPLIPTSHARELYARAREPKELVIIPRGNHDLPNLNEKTKEILLAWMDRAVSFSEG